MNAPNPAPHKEPASFVAVVLAGHSALGLTFAALIYIVCLSGTIAVFANELRRWEQPDVSVIAATPAVLERAVQSGYERALQVDALGDIFVQAPNPALPRLLVEISGAAGGQENWLANPEGNLDRAQVTPWWEFLIGLHYRLLVPGLWGLVLVGAIGLFTLSLIISGVLAHPRIFRDAFLLRWGGSKHLQEADLHNRMSVWGLPFHLVIAFSGAVLGLSAVTLNFLVGAAYGEEATQAYTALYGPGPGQNRAPAPIPDIEAILGQVSRRYPDAAIDALVIQQAATEGQLVHVTTSRPQQLNLAERHFFDGGGNWLRTAGYDDGPAGLQWTAAMTALHFGSFGGVLVKLAYGILGAALTLVTTTGVTIWLARSAAKGRLHPGWQRLWAATVWGQVMALGAAALAAHGGTTSFVVTIYLLVMALALAGAGFVRDPDLWSRGLRVASAAILGVVAILHSFVWASSMTDGMGWIIEAAIVVLAAAVGASAFGNRHMGRSPL